MATTFTKNAFQDTRKITSEEISVAFGLRVAQTATAATSPSKHVTFVCEGSALDTTTCYQNDTSVMMGTSWFPCPSFPLYPSPHENTSPSNVQARVCAWCSPCEQLAFEIFTPDKHPLGMASVYLVCLPCGPRHCLCHFQPYTALH